MRSSSPDVPITWAGWGGVAGGPAVGGPPGPQVRVGRKEPASYGCRPRVHKGLGCGAQLTLPQFWGPGCEFQEPAGGALGPVSPSHPTLPPLTAVTSPCFPLPPPPPAAVQPLPIRPCLPQPPPPLATVPPLPILPSPSPPHPQLCSPFPSRPSTWLTTSHTLRTPPDIRSPIQDPSSPRANSPPCSSGPLPAGQGSALPEGDRPTWQETGSPQGSSWGGLL